MITDIEFARTAHKYGSKHSDYQTLKVHQFNAWHAALSAHWHLPLKDLVQEKVLLEGRTYWENLTYQDYLKIREASRKLRHF